MIWNEYLHLNQYTIIYWISAVEERDEAQWW